MTTKAGTASREPHDAADTRCGIIRIERGVNSWRSSPVKTHAAEGMFLRGHEACASGCRKNVAARKLEEIPTGMSVVIFANI